MNESAKFNDGDWVSTEDGICQVYGSADYYVEEFSKHEFEGLKVGDVFQNKVVYKILCDFDGTPRKTKFFSYLSSKYCELLEGEYKKIYELCKAEHPDMYEKFLLRKPSKHVTSRVEFSLRIESDVQEMVVAKINDLLNEIPKPFCYEEFDTYLRVNLDIKLPEKLYVAQDTMMTNTLVSLVYNVLELRNKKFSFCGGVALKAYCSHDEK